MANTNKGQIDKLNFLKVSKLKLKSLEKLFTGY